MGSHVGAGGLCGSVAAFVAMGCVVSVETEHHESDGTGDRSSSGGGFGTGRAPRGGSTGTGGAFVNMGGRSSGGSSGASQGGSAGASMAGASYGGTSSGGASSGGASNGGASNGGASSGGASNGGTGSGGTSAGGASGNTGAGGAPTCMPVMNVAEGGTWVEVAQIPCNGGPEHAPMYPIEELIFEGPGGLMKVTWRPFETYVDYWSTYTIGSPNSPGGAHITLTSIDGAYIPKDIDADGSIARCGEELVFRSMWLGTSRDAINPNRPPPAPECGHRFRKR